MLNGKPLIFREETEAQRRSRCTKVTERVPGGAGNPTPLGQASSRAGSPAAPAPESPLLSPHSCGPRQRKGWRRRGPLGGAGRGQGGARRPSALWGWRGATLRGAGSGLHSGRTARPRPTPSRPSPCLALPPRALQGASSLSEAHTRRFLPGASGRRPAGGCGREPTVRRHAAKEGAAGGAGNARPGLLAAGRG